MDEDCLHVNVFTNRNCLTQGGCPILYYVHGGAWFFDSPNLLPIDYLVDNWQSRDIVLVSVIYRLASFGFFNTGKRVMNSSAVKNAGLLGILVFRLIMILYYPSDTKF